MTNELRELQKVHNANRRANESGVRNAWVRESKAGKCYTYRGVKYCYAMW